MPLPAGPTPTAGRRPGAVGMGCPVRLLRCRGDHATPIAPRVRVLFAGSPEVALPSLRTLVAGPHQVVGVLTRPDAPAGRGRGLRPSPVAVTAAGAGLPVLRPARVGDPDALAAIAALAPECAVVVAYGALLPQRALDTVAGGWVNLHFSLLPRWRGAAPVQHAVFAGDRATGVTTFRIVRELDAGPIYDSVSSEIGPHETSGDVLARLAELGSGVLARTLERVAVGDEPVPQPSDGTTLAPKVTVADAAVDWRLDAAVVDRQVRGCTPAPGPWTTFRGQRVKLGPVLVPASGGRSGDDDLSDSSVAPGPGELAVRFGPGRVEVGTGSGPVTLSTVQPAGRPATDAAAWARGARPIPGERFGA